MDIPKDMNTRLDELGQNMAGSSTSVQIQIMGIKILNLIHDIPKLKGTHNVVKLLLSLSQNSKFAQIRRMSLQQFSNPYHGTVIVFMAKRLRDSDADVRAAIFEKLIADGITLADIPNQKGRMLLIKEGLTDTDSRVKSLCCKFLEQSIKKQ